MDQPKITSLAITSMGNIIPIKLHSDNYLAWKALFLPILKKYKVLDLIDGSRSQPDQFLDLEKREINPEYLEWLEEDQTLLIWINSTLSDSVIPYVIGNSSSRELWKNLEDSFASSSTSHIFQLRDNLRDLRKENEKMPDFLTKVKKISDSLAAAGSPASSDELVVSILRALPPEYVLVYVDDILVTGNSSSACATLITQLSTRFAMKDLGNLHYFLGMEVHRDDSGLFLSQTKYTLDLLQKSQMADAKPCSSPLAHRFKLTPSEGTPLDDPTQYRSLVGALQYLTWTRPDINYAVSLVCQFMSKPTSSHLLAVKRILRYLKGTVDYGIQFTKSSSLDIQCYADADWGGSISDSRSTSGYVLYLGGNPISWSAKKQPTVSRSSTEAEYRSLAHTAAETIWVCSLLKDLQCFLSIPPRLWCDNISALALASNPVFHSKIKHLALDFHFIRELVTNKRIQLSHISTNDQIADILTKPLPGPRFCSLRSKLKLFSIPSA